MQTIIVGELLIFPLEPCMIFRRSEVTTVWWKPILERSTIILIAIDICRDSVVRMDSTSVLLCSEGNACHLTLFIGQKTNEFSKLCLSQVNKFWLCGTIQEHAIVLFSS